MTATLSSFTAWDWFCIFTAWLCLAIVAGVSLGRSIKRADATERAEVVNWLPLLPPVPRPVTPPFSQTSPAADLFDGMPVDCLSDDAIRPLFDRLMDMEGLR